MIADPAMEHVEQLARQLGLLAVGMALARALLLVAVEPEQDRQRPKPTREGYPHQDSEHHPAVAEAEHAESPRRAHGVEMATDAEHVRALLRRERVVDHDA